jgi:D-alanyl-D-alanine carboxypeptidase (penicillin-binding protein 5/6)
MYIRYFFWFFVLLAFHQSLDAEGLSISVNAEAAILMNAENGTILYEKNAHTIHFPASITKIATAAYALKKKGGQLDTIVVAEQESIASISPEAKRRSNYTMPPYWVEQGSNHMGIKKGEELTLRDLLYGMMVTSANDAANVIAQHVGGTIPNFMTEVNAWLKEIGCEDTYFCNPHGLHHPKHQTTAYDMALMTREALKDPMFRQLVSTVRYTRPKTNKQESTTLVQSNRLLKPGPHYYPKAIGVKTGGTTMALRTFVAAAKQDDRTLISVVLRTKERFDIFTDTIKMFETAFNQPKVQRILLKAGPQKFALEFPGASIPVKTYIKDNLAIDYYPAEEPIMKCLLIWEKLKLPIVKDQRVGELSVEGSQGEIIKKVPLYAAEDVRPTWIQWLKGLW